MAASKWFQVICPACQAAPKPRKAASDRSADGSWRNTSRANSMARFRDSSPPERSLLSTATASPRTSTGTTTHPMLAATTSSREHANVDARRAKLNTEVTVIRKTMALPMALPTPPPTTHRTIHQLRGNEASTNSICVCVAKTTSSRTCSATDTVPSVRSHAL